MLTMRAYHAILFSNVDENNGYFRNLARLTQTDLSQIKALESEATWDIWH